MTNRWVSARSVALKKGQSIEIEDDERVVTAEYHPPKIYLLVVKESYRDPNYDD